VFQYTKIEKYCRTVTIQFTHVFHAAYVCTFYVFLRVRIKWWWWWWWWW